MTPVGRRSSFCGTGTSFACGPLRAAVHTPGGRAMESLIGVAESAILLTRASQHLQAQAAKLIQRSLLLRAESAVIRRRTRAPWIGGGGDAYRIEGGSIVYCWRCGRPIRSTDTVVKRAGQVAHTNCLSGSPMSAFEQGAQLTRLHADVGANSSGAAQTRTITMTPVRDAAECIVAWDHHCSGCGSTWRDPSMRPDCPPWHCRRRQP